MAPRTQFDHSVLHEEHVIRANNAPPLADLCVIVLAENFALRPTLRGIPTRYIPRVTELLPTSLPLDVTAPLIDDESFWKRSALERWANCQLSEHGSSWKRLYFERNLTDFLEDFDPLSYTDGDATAELTRVLGISKDYIFSLRLKQFLSHYDMEMLFQHVPTLCHLDMTYGVKKIGMKYDRALFGMRLEDVSSLSKALRVTETLTILSLPCNLLDDNTVRILASGLHDNSTLTALDLSHNKIADRGVKAIARLLNDACVLVSLNLCDNHVHADGGKYFGHALKVNVSLRNLNLRLNRLGDEGTKLLLEGLEKNDSLTQLNLSCNACEDAAAQALCSVLVNCDQIRSLDMSCNELKEDAGRQIQDAMVQNSTLQMLDLRLNQIAPDTEAAINEACKANKQAATDSKRFKAGQAA